MKQDWRPASQTNQYVAWCVEDDHLECLCVYVKVVCVIQDGRTSLNLAAREGHLEVVQALLSKGAETEAKNAVRGLPRTVWYGQ